MPIFVICPALGVGIFLMRHKIYKARKKCCSCVSSNGDKDGAKVEDANGEFSHELQIKMSSSGQPNANAYDISTSDWV